MSKQQKTRLFVLCAVFGGNNYTFISRDDAFSQRQAAWLLLLLPTASCSLHLQQVRCDPEWVVTHLTVTVLPAPKIYTHISISTVNTGENKLTLVKAAQ